MHTDVHGWGSFAARRRERENERGRVAAPVSELRVLLAAIRTIPRPFLFPHELHELHELGGAVAAGLIFSTDEHGCSRMGDVRAVAEPTILVAGGRRTAAIKRSLMFNPSTNVHELTRMGWQLRRSCEL